MRYISLIFASAALCFLTSCSSSFYKSPMLASTKSAAVPPHRVLGKVEVHDCAVFYYALLIPIASYVDIKKMYNGVLEQARGMGGDAVVDFQVRETKVNNALFFYMQYCYSAVGTAVKFADGRGSAWDASPDGNDAPSAWDAPPPEKQGIESVWD